MFRSLPEGARGRPADGKRAGKRAGARAGRRGPWRGAPAALAAAALGLALVALSAAGPAGAEGAAQDGAAPATERPKPLRPQADMAAQEKALDALVKVVADPAAPPPNVDAALWRASISEGNEPTADRIALGRKLYFDERLSADGTVSCATCHDTTRGFTDQMAQSEGIRKQLGTRNAPTTINAALLATQFWYGRAKTLEEQAGLPILNPIEMGRKSREEVVAALKAMPDSPPLFRKAYGRDVNYPDIERAIAAFERTLVFFDAPFDRFVAGDESALSADAQAGWALFNGKARCVTCHPVSPSTPLFTDDKFHNIGVAARHQDFEGKAREALALLAEDSSAEALDRLALETALGELGRFLVTRNYSDLGAFRTPQLRNAGVTAPYMHDGSLATLWDVMDHYNKGGEENPFLDGGMVPLELTEEEIDQVVAFLFSLTSERLAALNQEELARQKALAQKERPIRDEDMAFRKTLAFERRVFQKERAQQVPPAKGDER